MKFFKSKIIVVVCLFSFLGTGNELFSQVHCGTAAYVTVNGNCVNKTLSNLSGCEAPTPAGSTCVTPPATASYRDVWAKFTAIATTATITGAISVAQNITIVTYSSPCSASNTVTNVAELGCSNSNNTNAAQTETLTMTGLTIGQDYFIRLINTNNVGVTINLCVTSTPANDDPSGAGPTSSYSLTAPSSTCTYTLGNIKGASKTTCGGLAAPTCTSYGASSVDAWYSVITPASGNLFLQTLAGTMTQFGIATYTGTPCTSLTQIGCSEGNPEGNSTGAPSLYVPGQTPGSTVYIRVWNKNGQTAGTFSICATTLGPCGNVATNDFCSNPASVSTSGATFTSVATNSTTAGIYTADSPGNLNSNSCTSGIGENAWFSFIATTTSQAIPFNVAGCAGGLEAEVFNVSTNAYGCCKTFTPVSSGSPFPACTSYSIANNSSGTITASPLVIGNTYYLMVNSITGQTCTYSVTGWSTTGILPTELVSFKGNNEGKYNAIEWITSNENNIKSYTLEHSDSGDDFIPVATINAKGNNTSNTIYRVLDDSPFEDVTYYRVKHTEIGGIEKYSNIISVNLKGKYDNIFNIHPNPTSNNLNFEFYSKTNSAINIELLNYAGASILKLSQPLEEGKNNITLPMSELDNGVYILKVVSERSGKTTHHKIIKN